jgi:hypothetical protein
MGRTNTAKRTRTFFRNLEKKGKRINRITETIMRGAWGTQSCNIPSRIYQKEPGLSVWKGSMIICPL